jgi:hypothetical protein
MITARCKAMRIYLTFIGIYLFILSCSPKKDSTINCSCDTLKLKSELRSVRTDSIKKSTNFYELDSETNRQLWFEDIESIDSTQYTRLWDSYHDNNFYASHRDFKAYYKGATDTQLAIQIGPAGILWTYFTFVLKKRNCCYILTRATFTHARFRYKAYSLISHEKVDSLFGYLKTLKKEELTEEEANYAMASFVDNNNEQVFDVSLEEPKLDKSNEQHRMSHDSSMMKFINFLEANIQWTETYPLEIEKPDHNEPVRKYYDTLQITGSYKINNETGFFFGTIAFEQREKYIQYTWSLVSNKEKLLAAKSSIINFPKISDDPNEFEQAKAQAIEEIKQYKIRGKKIVTEMILN